MAITDRDRRDMYAGLAEALGDKIANNLMSILPFQPADELATRTDVLAIGSQLRGEMAELRGEMAELRAEVRGDISRLDARITSVEGSLRNEIADLRNHTTRMMAGAIAANAVAVITALSI